MDESEAAAGANPVEKKKKKKRTKKGAKNVTVDNGHVLDTARFDRWYRGSPLKMIFSATKGRCLVAGKGLAENESVLKTYPLLWTPDEGQKHHICRYCLSQAPDGRRQPLRCKGCKEVRYCSSRCRAYDSPLHDGYECSLISAWELDDNYETALISEMKLLVRAVARKRFDSGQHLVQNDNYKCTRKNNNNNKPKYRKHKKKGNFSRSEATVSFNDYSCLISSPEGFSRETIDSLREWICDYLARLSKWLGWGETEETLLHLLIRNRRNSFSVWDDESNGQRGIAVYVRPSFLNHSCDPNLSIRRDCSSLLEFYALRHIDAEDELTISYVNVDDPVLERRQKLAENYLFLCDCPRCLREVDALPKGQVEDAAGG